MWGNLRKRGHREGDGTPAPWSRVVTLPSVLIPESGVSLRGRSGVGLSLQVGRLGVFVRKRASPRGEAGTSVLLSVSDFDRRVPAELGSSIVGHKGYP